MASGESGQAGKNENAEFIVMGSPLQQRRTTRTGANTGEQAGAREALTIAIASHGQRCEFSLIG
ncbi:hypothetical protein [Paraburkholderia sp. RAU2J]|uniref:hypothetical protein n=1 Tax=Paraburkholderia sp. RAU2J TaxID=1938810 RepID=UPI0018F3AD6A|nr:hypothetical protein [Paraburkholderia sp. RAU2J]